MGITTRYYTVYGVYHEGYDSDLGDLAYERKFDLIMDSMGGEYHIVGATLFDGGDMRWGEPKDEFKKIALDELDRLREEYSEKFREVLPEYADKLKGNWQLMTFVHYS